MTNHLISWSCPLSLWSVLSGGDAEAYSTDDELINVVDGVLEFDDLNGDGYVSFFEFMSSQGRGEELEENK